MKVAHEAGQPTRQPMPLIKRLRTVASAGAPPKRGALAVTAEMVSAEDQTTVIKPVNVQTQEDERTLRVFDLLAAFLALNPTPSDQQIHALAGLAGLNPEYFESVIYRLVGVIQKEEEKTTGEDGLRNKIQELLNEDPMDTPAQPPKPTPQVDPVETLDDDPEGEESQVSDEEVETLDDPDEGPEVDDAVDDSADDEESDETLEDPDEIEEDSDGVLEDTDEAKDSDKAEGSDDEELAEDPEDSKKSPPKKPAKEVPPGKDGKVESSIQRRIEASDPYGRAAEHDGVVDEELMGHPDPMKDASENDGALDEELE